MYSNTACKRCIVSSPVSIYTEILPFNGDTIISRCAVRGVQDYGSGCKMYKTKQSNTATSISMSNVLNIEVSMTV